MRRASIFVLTLVLTVSAQAAGRSGVLLTRAWPGAPFADLRDIGTGVGLVFSPDLSVPGNCHFYQTLGFACFESADWLEVLGQIHTYNMDHPGRRIRTLVLETHGTNGHGLKIQTGKKPDEARSYIAVAALQEILEPAGVRYIVLSACNSGRLLRPEIYRKLNREPGDKLFLPATRGIIDATDSFSEKRTSTLVITPGASHIETTLVGSIRELAPSTREALIDAAKAQGIKLPRQFAISEMLIQMLLRDPQLELRTGAHVEELSKVQTTPEDSETLFNAFVAHINYVAARAAKPATQSAAGSR
jgi:hypothetical protein